ncbi:MAG: hypothetical protein K1X91_09265 [Bacteriodetes bacterium]|nr:hypothetical protein [Bacteroidota bacterium]
MKTLLIITSLLISMSLTSCLQHKEHQPVTEDPYKDFQEHTVLGEYSLKAPTYMSTATSLNDEASLQLKNLYKAAYVIVIDESKQEFIDAFKELEEYKNNETVLVNYRLAQVNSLRETAFLSNISNPDKQRINGLDAEVVTANGYVEESGKRTDIVYTLGFIEGPEKMYLVMAWTSADKAEKLKEDYLKVIRSFKLLTGSKNDSTTQAK